MNIGKHFLGGVTGNNFCSTGGGGGGGSLGRQIGGASLLLNILLNEGLNIRYREDNYSNIIFDLVYWLLFYSIIYDAILAGAWERFLPRGGPSNTKNEIFPILKIFTL